MHVSCDDTDKIWQHTMRIMLPFLGICSLKMYISFVYFFISSIHFLHVFFIFLVEELLLNEVYGNNNKFLCSSIDISYLDVTKRSNLVIHHTITSLKNALALIRNNVPASTTLLFNYS